MSHPQPSKTDRAREGGETREVVETDVAESEAKEADDAGLRTLFLDDDDAGDLISSLSSSTARSILVALHDDAATASELANSVDTSVQNVRHHLDGLQDAGLVEVADQRYSSKGREMDVYAPVDEPLVVFVGREESDASFVDSLKRFFGAIGILALTSVLIQWLIESQAAAGGADGISRVPDGGVGVAVGPLGVPAGALVFAGGALVLTLVSAWRYWSRHATPATS